MRGSWEEGRSSARLNFVSKDLENIALKLQGEIYLSIWVSCVKNGSCFYPNLNMLVYIPRNDMRETRSAQFEHWYLEMYIYEPMTLIFCYWTNHENFANLPKKKENKEYINACQENNSRGYKWGVDVMSSPTNAWITFVIDRLITFSKLVTKYTLKK